MKGRREREKESWDVKQLFCARPRELSVGLRPLTRRLLLNLLSWDRYSRKNNIHEGLAVAQNTEFLHCLEQARIWRWAVEPWSSR